MHSNINQNVPTTTYTQKKLEVAECVHALQVVPLFSAFRPWPKCILSQKCIFGLDTFLLLST